MEEEENMLPPFWLQTNDTLRRVDHRRRRHLLRRSTSIFLNSGALVVFLLVIALVFIFIIIPSVLSFPSHVFRPQSVKKSWDSLNLVLVLFAIVCGFLSRNSNENTNSYEDQSVSISGSGAPNSNPSTPRQWYGNQYSDRTPYMTRLRSSSSYPDLRQEYNWVSRDDRWRSYDDSHLNSYRISSSADQELHYRRPWQQEPEAEPEHEPVVDRNFREEGSYSQPAPPSQEPPPPPPPPASPPRPVTPPQPSKKVGVKRKPKRSEEALGENERISTSTDFEAIVEISYPPPSPILIPIQTPPPPPISVYVETERKSSGKNEKKRGVVSKEFLISSLRRKKKKQRQKSVENFDAIITSSVPSSSSSSSSLLLTAPPSHSPPPPPPPPPPSAFHSLFSSKKGKTKTSISQPQPPSSPPPPRRKHTSTVSASKTKPSSPIRARRFPLPETTTTTSMGTSSIGVEYDNVNRGNESPLIPIPPPPPPPPFKLPAWKFVRHGDFVRINSNNSSRSGSPDLDDGEDSGSMETSPVAINGGAMEVGESSTAMFCPSPDVNSKADTFIARFRAGLKLEKMNSAKQRKSTLGPQSSPTPHQYKD